MIAPPTSGTAEEPRRLPLHDLHIASGARLAPFGGHLMPIHYPLGVLGEHLHTRALAGLFDVSHMGQIILRPRSGNEHDAARVHEIAHALEGLVPVDIESLKEGRQRYALFTNSAGGILDDLMIANLGGRWLLVVNAASTRADLAHLHEHLDAECHIEMVTDRALLALQGPGACEALAALVPAVLAMRFMDVRTASIDGTECWITRSGYTGEDGFEISVPNAAAAALAERLLASSSVQWVGLGARDSLRLEAGLCLHGHDLNAATTPVEAALEFVISAARRSGGARAGAFPGSDIILEQMANGAPRRRVGLRSKQRPVREGAALYPDEHCNVAVGHVTSGTFAPSLQFPVAMAYLPLELASPGSQLFADVRGQRTPVTVAAMPFVPHRYCR